MSIDQDACRIFRDKPRTKVTRQNRENIGKPQCLSETQVGFYNFHKRWIVMSVTLQRLSAKGS